MKESVQLAGKHIHWIKSEATQVWSIKFKTDDGYKTVSTGQRDKRAAVKMVRELRLHHFHKERFRTKVMGVLSGCNRTTMEAAIKEWTDSIVRFGTVKEGTALSYRKQMRQFAKATRMMAEQPVVVTEEHINRYVNSKNGWKATTRSFKLTILKEFFEWCLVKKYALTNPAKAVNGVNMQLLSHEQKEPKKKIPFTLDEVAFLLRHIEQEIAETEGDGTAVFDARLYHNKINRLKFWHAAVIISRYTGLRIGDVACLERASVGEKELIVWTRKRDKRVALPLNDELREALGKHVNGSQYLFPTQRALAASLGLKGQLSEQFGQILIRAGIEGRSFHCLRSTAALDMRERLIASGCTEEHAEEIVAAILGHSSVTTTQQHYLWGKPANNGGESL